VKRLTLVRHAKSSWKHAGLPDFDRPLNGRGREEAPEMGRRLAARGILPDIVVSSPAKRAWSTARKVARKIGFPEGALREDEAIYEADVAALLGVLRGLDPLWGHAMLVGHNPGLTELANFLVGEEIAEFPTCGVASLLLGVDAWEEVGKASGTVVFFDAPRSPPVV
jgi:phosphohistidine phosphatase